MPDRINGPGIHPDELPFRLGCWIKPKEEKDPRRYAMHHFLEEAAPKTAAFYNPGKILDQGNTSSCVGHAGRGYELMDPNPTPPTQKDGPPATLDTSIPAIQLYKGAQDDDPWPGSEWQDPKYEGSSLSGLAKYMQDNGIVSGGYAWAQTPDDVSNWLRTKGPICFASLWTHDMFQPDGQGFLHVSGSLAGGHAYRFFGIDEQGAWYMANNWSEDWGLKNQTFTDVNGKQFTVRGGVAKIAPSEQPKLFADGSAEGFSPIKIPATPTPGVYHPGVERTSLSGFYRGDWAREVVITKGGRELAYSQPKPAS